jgi:hypothetical protein
MPAVLTSIDDAPTMPTVDAPHQRVSREHADVRDYLRHSQGRRPKAALRAWWRTLSLLTMV